MNGNGCLHRDNGKPRRCKRRGCTTWLSSYNRDGVCVVHGGWKAQLVDESRPWAAKERGELLQEILVAA